MKCLYNNIKIILCLNLIIGLHLSQISHSIKRHTQKITQEYNHDTTPTFIERIKIRTRNKDALASGILGSKLAAECIKGSMAVVSPAFCWKPLPLLSPPECPSGYEQGELQCYKRCNEGYTRYFGKCRQNCPLGSTDFIFWCRDGFLDWSNKDIYTPESIYYLKMDNCIKPFIKSNNLFDLGKCKLECKNIGLGESTMINCGPLACASSTKECALNILSMIFDVLLGIADFVTFIMTLGTSTAIKTTFDVAKGNAVSAAKKATSSSIKEGFSRVKKIFSDKEVLNTVFKQVEDGMLDFASNLKSKIQRGAASEFCKGMIGKVVDNQNTPDPDWAATSINSLDIIGIKADIDACSEEIISANCLRNVIGNFSNIDPTGLLTIISTFIYPTCDSTLKGALTQSQDMDPYSVKIYELTNFKGKDHSTNVDISNIGQGDIKMDDMVSSVKIGRLVAAIFYEHPNYEGETYMLGPGLAMSALPKLNEEISSLQIVKEGCVVFQNENHNTFSSNDWKTQIYCKDEPIVDWEVSTWDSDRTSIYNYFPESQYIKIYPEENYKGEPSTFKFTSHPIKGTQFSDFNTSKTLLKSIKSFQIIKSESHLEKVQDGCIEIYEYCFFGGLKKLLCDIKISNLKIFSGKTSSIRIGSEINPIFFNGVYSGNYFQSGPNENFECLSDLLREEEDSAGKFDNSILSVITKPELCVLITIRRSDGRIFTKAHCIGDIDTSLDWTKPIGKSGRKNWHIEFKFLGKGLKVEVKNGNSTKGTYTSDFMFNKKNVNDYFTTMSNVIVTSSRRHKKFNRLN